MSQDFFLVKDVKNFLGIIIPYAFQHVKLPWEIAIFDSKNDAIEAIGIAREHDGGDYLPIILETVIK